MSSSPTPPEAFVFLKDLIYRHSGIHLTEKEEGVLFTRVTRRLRELSLDSVARYVTLLQGAAAAEEIPALLDAVTINYTFFFRENGHLQFLRSEVFPRLFSDGHGGAGRRIRGWSAGCSSGEEPYSIAMTFAEAVRDVESTDFRVVSTDINRRVLRIGAKGVYPLSRLSGVPQEYRYKYLTRDGETPAQCLRVSPELRALALFRRLNVLEPVEAFRGAFDFVFCRNVMIYFDEPTHILLLRKFHESLRPGGYLFVGAKEDLSGIPHPFHRVGAGIFRKS